MINSEVRMARKSRLEMESILLFNEEESAAKIYTHNKRLQKRLSDLCEKYPEEFRLERDDGDGALTFSCPKRRIGITAPRRMTAEQKEQACKNILQK